MITYSIITLSIFILLNIQGKIKIKQIDIGYIALIFVGFLLIFTPNNPDYKVYKLAYDHGYGPFTESGMWSVHKILSIAGLTDYKFFLILLYLVIIFTFVKWKEFCPRIQYVIFFYSLFVMYYDCIRIRNTVVAFLSMLAIYYCVKRKYVFCIILCIIAPFFHALGLLTDLMIGYLMLTSLFDSYTIRKIEIYIVTLVAFLGTAIGNRMYNMALNFDLTSKVFLYQAKSFSFDSFLIWGGMLAVVLFLLWEYAVKDALNREDLSEEKIRAISMLYRFGLFGIAVSGLLLYIDEINRLFMEFYLALFFLFGIVESSMTIRGRNICLFVISSANILFMFVAMYRGINFDAYF